MQFTDLDFLLMFLRIVVSRMDETSTDYEISQIIQLKKYLDERGINLLYVNEPAKYIDDNVYRSEFDGEWGGVKHY